MKKVMDPDPAGQKSTDPDFHPFIESYPFISLILVWQLRDLEWRWYYTIIYTTATIALFINDEI